MTTLLEQAFAEATKLSDREQDVIAAWLMEELASERRWSNLFDASSDALEQLADEV